MRLLVDVNVLLDIFLNRSPWVADAEQLLKGHVDGKLQLLVSAISLPTIFYVVRRHVGRDRAWQVVVSLRSQLEVVGVDQGVIMHACSLGGDDFEDSLQAASAISAGAAAIVSRDQHGYVAHPLKVLSPQEAVAALATLS